MDAELLHTLARKLLIAKCVAATRFEAFAKNGGYSERFRIPAGCSATDKLAS